jgi:hypothetical protein
LCGTIGSPLYAHLLAAAADDVEAGGPCWHVLEGHETEPLGSVLALRFMAAAHRLVLRGEAPALARHYPSAGGDAAAGDAWRDFRAVVADHAAELRELVELPVQTNEVGRCAALLGGFLYVARLTGLPLATLEIGCSAGLNLRWHRWLYDAGPAGTWGEPGSPVRLGDRFDPAPPLDVAVEVADRRGCDAQPLDVASDADRETLLACTWPDQAERFAQLDAALRVAAGDPVAIDRAPAAEWLEGRLAERRPGVATVVFQSLVLQYLDDDQRTRARAAMEAAGTAATEDAPLAWLRMEPGGELAEVRLRTWPGGEDALVARAGYHGRPVHWLTAS